MNLDLQSIKAKVKIFMLIYGSPCLTILLVFLCLYKSVGMSLTDNFDAFVGWGFASWAFATVLFTEYRLVMFRGKCFRQQELFQKLCAEVNILLKFLIERKKSKAEDN